MKSPRHQVNDDQGRRDLEVFIAGEDATRPAGDAGDTGAAVAAVAADSSGQEQDVADSLARL